MSCGLADGHLGTLVKSMFFQVSWERAKPWVLSQMKICASFQCRPGMGKEDSYLSGWLLLYSSNFLFIKFCHHPSPPGGGTFIIVKWHVSAKDECTNEIYPLFLSSLKMKCLIVSVFLCWTESFPFWYIPRGGDLCLALGFWTTFSPGDALPTFSLHLTRLSPVSCLFKLLMEHSPVPWVFAHFSHSKLASPSEPLRWILWLLSLALN